MKIKKRKIHLFVCFEDVAPEEITGWIPGDIAKYLQIL